MTADETSAAREPYREERLRTPMPPSLRRQFRGTSRKAAGEKGRKGIPPWRLRQQHR